MNGFCGIDCPMSDDFINDVIEVWAANNDQSIWQLMIIRRYMYELIYEALHNHCAITRATVKAMSPEWVEAFCEYAKEIAKDVTFDNFSLHVDEISKQFHPELV